MHADHIPTWDPDDFKRVVRDVCVQLRLGMRQYMGLPPLSPDEVAALEVQMAMEINKDAERRYGE